MPDVPADAITAREAIARCLADVEDFPEPEHYALADDVLLALDNAGVAVAAAPALRAQGAAAERADAELRIADAVATEFCRIRALAKKVRAVYPNPGADRGPLREVLQRQPYLSFADLLDGGGDE